MPTHPITRCKICDCAIQLHLETRTATMIANGSMSKPLFSSQLDSERFPAYCRGQGSFYKEKHEDPYAFPKCYDTHFNFSGVYSGMCCYCALVKGYNMGSFLSVGCYHCQRSDFIVKEFSKLKGHGKNRKAAASSWDSCGWGGLSDSIIDLILQIVVENKPMRRL